MKTKISENFKKCFYWMRIIVIGIVLGVSLQFVRAWTEPTLPAPSGNVSGPLNISATGQSKAGGLILNTGGATNGLIVSNGNVGIGTMNPGFNLDIYGTGGAYLRLDGPANGNPAIMWYQNGAQRAFVQWNNAGSYLDFNPGSGSTMVIKNGGNVGIGTASPAAKLDVSGGIKIGTDATCNAGKAGTVRYNSASKKLEFCDGANWVAIVSGGSFSDCVVETSGTGGEMLTHTCTNGRSVVSGSCWRRSWGTFIGNKLNSDGTFTCRIEASGGLDITVRCCK